MVDFRFKMIEVLFHKLIYILIEIKHKLIVI